jgi:hypothetical protein
MWRFRNCRPILSPASRHRPQPLPMMRRAKQRRQAKAWSYGLIAKEDSGASAPRRAAERSSCINRQWHDTGLVGLFSGQEVEFRPVLWVGRHVRAENLRLIAGFTE